MDSPDKTSLSAADAELLYRELAEAQAEVVRLQHAIEIAARDDCGPKTTKRILREALRGAVGGESE